MGGRESCDALIQGMSAVLSAAGHVVTYQKFDRFPSTGALARHLAKVDEAHDKTVWFLEAEQSRDEALAKQCHEHYRAQRTRCMLLFLRNNQIELSREGHAPEVITAVAPPASLALAHRVLGVSALHRRLLTVVDSFRIASRGLVLAPKVDPPLLPGKLPRRMQVEVRSPDGSRRRLDATAAIEQTRPPTSDRGITLLLDTHAENVQAGSEIWLLDH